MTRLAPVFMAAVLLGLAVPAVDAQSRRPGKNDRPEVARAQGVPPGQLPPASQCRVWYANRPPGQQPSPTSCARAEAVAARDHSARVIYGEDSYWDARQRDLGRNSDRDRDNGRYSDDDWDDDRAVRRGSVRDPRRGGTSDDRDARAGSPAFRNGYRDGLTKGREDVEDGDRYEVGRHSWYRSATRGYESRLGTRYDYIDRYRRGFEAGYAEGYRVYQRW